MADFRPFQPPWYLRPSLMQSILASRSIRARNAGRLLEASREVMLELTGGVRLLGFHAPNPNENSKGLVILIHGWEGGASSAYVLSAGAYFFDRGYSIFRLNLRDHGDTHQLNRGMFFATLIDESFDAVGRAAEMAGSSPAFLVGFSLGGNFVLRIALKCAQNPIPNLVHTAAISPVINPEAATNAVDGHPLIRRYFVNKWFRSLKKKQELYPDDYDFSEALSLKTVRGATGVFVRQYSDFASTSDYFSRYTLTGDTLAALPHATTIITSSDDQIIPVADFYNLHLNDQTECIIHDHGGHSGFIENLNFDGWHEEYLAKKYLELTG